MFGVPPHHRMCRFMKSDWKRNRMYSHSHVKLENKQITAEAQSSFEIWTADKFEREKEQSHQWFKSLWRITHIHEVCPRSTQKLTNIYRIHNARFSLFTVSIITFECEKPGLPLLFPLSALHLYPCVPIKCGLSCSCLQEHWQQLENVRYKLWVRGLQPHTHICQYWIVFRLK